jgi:hypothetical protein
VLAWALSTFTSAHLKFRVYRFDVVQGTSQSTLRLMWTDDLLYSLLPAAQWKMAESYDFLGRFVWLVGENGGMISLPYSVLTTTLLPPAIGPFLSFRFRLWHYLAYTVLVALELAYYLRWQG